MFVTPRRCFCCAVALVAVAATSSATAVTAAASLLNVFERVIFISCDL